MTKQSIRNLNEVSRTLLIPLFVRATESRRPDAIIRDARAVELVGRIDYDFSGVERPQNEQVSFLLRMREFDRRARTFLEKNPDGVVVDLGCGLDTRFERIDNGRMEWFGLDLPEVIDLRRDLLAETPRSHFIGCSVLDFAWMDAIPAGRPVLFLAEAVLVYLEEADVRRLVQTLTARFPGSELVCEVYAPVVNRHPRPKVVAQPRWGLKNDRDVEAWSPGIRLLDNWGYFDQPEPRLGAMQIMRFFPALGRMVRVVHYRLGGPASA
jgi:O-methyltransferase involved in polyketide biosynthesis